MERLIDSVAARRRRAAAAREAGLRDRVARAAVELFDQLYEGAVLIDAAGTVLWMNDKYRAILGWNGMDPVEGRPVEDIIPNSRLREVVASGRADLIDIFEVEGRQLVVSRIPLKDEDGRVSGAVGMILYDRVQSLKPLVDKFQGMQRDLETARRQLADARRAKYGFSQFIGNSEAVRLLKRQARRAAERDITVLLLGETGTGKEMLAHALHAASERQAGPMVRVNTAAIPENLLEAELFGVAPGAYTGAGNKPRDGKIRLAHGGTLFLDEIGEIPLQQQVKLLRLIETGVFRAVGSVEPQHSDVRLVCATHRNLKKMVDEGRFRQDLYYRISPFPIPLPSLKERIEDLPLLVDALLQRLPGGEDLTVSRRAIRVMTRYSFPGNIRELRNILERAVLLSDNGVIDVDQLPEQVVGTRPEMSAEGGVSADPQMILSLEQVEARYLRQVVARFRGDNRDLAAHLGISERTLYRKLSQLKEREPQGEV